MPDATDPRTLRTKTAFEQAALYLLERDGFDGLGPAAIAREAGSARTTFYLHYREPWETVRDGLARVFTKEYPEAPQRGEPKDEDIGLNPETLLAGGRPLSFPLFDHVERHAALYRTIFSDPRGAPIVSSITALTAERSRAEHTPLRELAPRPVDPNLVAAYLAGALVQSVSVWIQTDERRPAAEMAYWFSQMAAPGLLATMGLGELLEG